jgi:hypothetical protein
MSAITYDQGQFSDLIRIKKGLQSLDVIQGPTERWGDYFGAQQYYPEYGKIWVAGTFGAADRRHSTWIAELISPFGTSPAGIDPSKINTIPSVLYPNPSFQRSFIRFNLPTAGPVICELFDQTGRSLGVIYEGLGLSGEQEIGFEIGHLKAATYLIRLSTPQGLITKTIIKN